MTRQDLYDLVWSTPMTHIARAFGMSDQAWREYGLRRFKSMKQAQRFATAHAAVANLFNLGRHLIRADHYRNLRAAAFSEWDRAVA